MGTLHSKFAYSVGVTAIAGIIAYVLLGPSGGAKRRNGDLLQVKGLQNMGSTCYISAVIQSLAACDHFREFVRLYYRRYNPVDGNGRSILNSKSQLFPLVAALHRACLLVNRQDKSDSPEQPAPHVLILRILASLKYRLPRGSEQDSFELFEFIMAGIQEELVRMVKESKTSDYACLIPNADTDEYPTPLIEVVVEKNSGVKNDSDDKIVAGFCIVDAGGDKSIQFREMSEMKSLNTTHRLGYFHSVAPKIVGNPFIGCMASRLKCLTCMTENPWNVEKFHGITLPLPAVTANRVLLKDLLNNYLRTVIVHDVECKGCTEKQGSLTKSSFSKSTVIVKMPKSLCLQIQRSTWSTFGSYKRSDYVVFSEILDLSKIHRLQDYILMSSRRKKGTENKDIGIDPVSRTSHYHNHRSQYRLCAVISHSGVTDSGHFITFRRGSVDKELWFLTSDEEVIEVPLVSVFTSTAYMLFYELIENVPDPLL